MVTSRLIGGSALVLINGAEADDPRIGADDMPFQLPYKAAVIGHTGRGDYGHGLDLAFLNEPRLKLVAVADPDDAGRAKAGERLKLSNVYADYRTMLEKERPAFVAIAPRFLDGHRGMIEACAGSGVRGIFCEKPLCPTLADADAIAAACHGAHVQLASAMQTRFGPRFDRVKELIREGSIGEVLELRGRGKEDRRGGGEDLMVLGTHIVDMFRGLLGEPAWCAARVTEAGRSIDAGSVRDGAEGIGLLAGDRIDATYGFRDTPVVAHFNSSRPAEPGRRFGLEILGSKGVIWVGMGWLPGAYFLPDPTWLGTSVPWQPITSQGLGKPETLSKVDIGEANRLIVADLVEAVEQDRPPKVGLADATAALEMVLAVYASQVAGNRPVALPLVDRASHPLEGLRAGR